MARQFWILGVFLYHWAANAHALLLHRLHVSRTLPSFGLRKTDAGENILLWCRTWGSWACYLIKSVLIQRCSLICNFFERCGSTGPIFDSRSASSLSLRSYRHLGGEHPCCMHLNLEYWNILKHSKLNSLKIFQKLLKLN